jgi:ubiquinone/menaquinone biosynthesis C-methylase UbiE
MSADVTMDTTSPASPPGDIDWLPTDQGYDRWAEIYDDEFNPLVALESPHVVRMMGDVRGLSILDVGCGTGRHTLHFAASGANLTAIDFSEGMLARARAKPGAERVRSLRHDLARPLPFEGGAFDRVLCGLVLDHIADLAGLFGEMGRVCRTDGFVVVSVMHPAMMLRGIQARFHDPRTGRDTRPASVPNQISDYVTAYTRAGLTLDEMSEHVVDDALVARAPRAGKYLGWPMLLMIRLRPA